MCGSGEEQIISGEFSRPAFVFIFNAHTQPEREREMVVKLCEENTHLVYSISVGTNCCWYVEPENN